MKQRFLALLKREYWENRGAFLVTPIAIGTVNLLGLIVAFSVQWVYDTDDHGLREGLRWLSTQPEGLVEHIFLQVQLGPFSQLFQLTLGVVVFFYLLGALYDDRKDRSILFWKSLPASDTLTLASKLASAMLVLPLLFFAVMVATHIVSVGLFSAMVALVGLNPWDVFLSRLSLLEGWGLMLASWLAMSVWALPLYGWLLLVSAFAPRIPLLFAVLPPLVFAFLQVWIEFLRTFTLGQDNLMGVIGQWFANSPLITGFEVNEVGDEFEVSTALGIPTDDSPFEHAVTLGNMLDRLVSFEMLIGLVVATASLAGALWLRRRATDN